jgi:multidrug resistance protein MdtO
MASVVSGKPVDDGVPDIRLSAAHLRQEFEKHYGSLGIPIPDEASDLAGLADSLATILAPLYEDILATYATQNQALNARVRLQHGHA